MAGKRHTLTDLVASIVSRHPDRLRTQERGQQIFIQLAMRPLCKIDADGVHFARLPGRWLPKYDTPLPLDYALEHPDEIASQASELVTSDPIEWNW